MDMYAKRLRDRKARSGRKKKRKQEAGDDDADDTNDAWPTGQDFWMSESSKALMQLWIQKAREGVIRVEKERASRFVSDLRETLSHMPESEDWYYSADLRTSGERLLAQGEQLAADRRSLESDEQVRVEQISSEMSQFEAEKRRQMEEGVHELERVLADQRRALMEDVDGRLQELQRDRDAKSAAFEKERAVSPASAQAQLEREHTAKLGEMDASIRAEREKAMADVEAKLAAKQQDAVATQDKRQVAIIERRKISKRQISEIQVDTVKKIKTNEMQWSNDANGWLSKAKTRIETRKSEDAAKAQRDADLKSRRKR